MGFAEGLIFIVILIDLAAFVLGAVLLGILYGILSRVKDRVCRAGILAAVPVLGFLLLMNTDVSLLLAGSLVFVVPAAALLPPFLFLGPSGRMPGIRRIVTCDILVSAAAAIQPFVLIRTEVSMVPFIYWHTPFSNALVYLCALAVDTALAALVYRVTRSGKPPVPDAAS